MEMLRSIVILYDKLYSNESSDAILSNLNDMEKKAFEIISSTELSISNKELRQTLSQNLYNCASNHPTFRSFLTTLTKKMIRVASMCNSKGSDIQKARFEIQEEYTAYRKMVMKGMIEVVLKFGKTLVKKAMTYHDYHTARNVIESIFQYYVSQEDDEQISFYHEKYTELEELCHLEHESKLFFGKVSSDRIADDLTRNELNSWIIKAQTRLGIESSDFHFFYYKILLAISDGTEYENHCKSAITYFENLYFNHATYLSIFRNRLKDYRIKQNDISVNTLGLLNDLLNNSVRYSNSWYLYAFTLVKVNINRGEIIESQKWIKRVLSSGKFRTLERKRRNQWKLMKMYLNIISGNFDEVKISSIKHSLGYKSVVKSNQNIPFLIGEIVYLLKIGELDLDKKINHLRKILHHTTTGNELERGIAFCDAVQHGVKFTVKKTEKSFDSEYIFYEKLLEKV
ncbi:MAG: hypothetical protein AAGA77_07575 [Bacteroidota bacterium]